MKLIRLLLKCLAVAAAVAAVLVLAAIAPAVQTFVAQRALSSQSGLRGTLGSLSAGFGGIDVEDLHLEVRGADLKLPSLQARLPITAAVLHRRVMVRSLVAKGWTLDLSGIGKAAGAPEQAALVREVVAIIHGILSGWRLPVDASLDGVELEGDVLLGALPGGNPVRAHLVMTGGGMSAGHEGAFEAAVTVPGSAFNTARCRLVVTMGSPRTVDRVGVTAGFSGGGVPRDEDLALSAEIAAARGAGEQRIDLVLSRGGRRIATLLGRFSEATRLAGTWKVDLRSTDLAPFVPYGPIAPFLAAGEGRFDADAALTLVRATGSLDAAVSGLGAIAPPLERLGTVKLGARFDLTHSGRSVRVDSLDVSIAGIRPIGAVRSLQPFFLDERTGDFKVSDPRGDWLQASLWAIPLEWLPGLPDGVSVSGGDAAGEFIVQAADGGFSLRQKSPFRAAGVSVQSAGRTLVRGLDLALPLAADYGPKGWRIQTAPLEAYCAGRRLATIEARASRPAGTDEPVTVAGKWSADLEAVDLRHAAPALGWITGRSASGEFSLSLGTPNKVEATLLVVGHNPGETVAASVRADVDPYGGVAFVVPVKISSGSNASDVSAEGTWIRESQGSWVKASVTGGSVTLGDLRLLAKPLAALGGAAFPAAAGSPAAGQLSSPGERDKAPFWRDWTGHVAVAFDRLRTGDQDLGHVGGVFDIDRGSIRMKGGRGEIEHRLLTNVEGSISFDANADFPYSIKAAAPVSEIDAGPLFAAAQPGTDPVFEGRFSVEGTLAGKGINLNDLLGRTEVEFRLASKTGIMRLLRANVAESLPEPPSTVSDALGSVGHVVGSVFGIREKGVDSAKSPLSKTTEAVLNFTYQVSEIGCDEITVKAIRGSDGAINLAEIEMISADEHLKGSGKIAYAKGVPLFKKPLSLELELGARGKAAELLATAGLLSSRKDSQGYAMLGEAVRFGGTLEHIDGSQWNDLLVKAATRKPDAAKEPQAVPARKPM